MQADSGIMRAATTAVTARPLFITEGETSAESDVTGVRNSHTANAELARPERGTRAPRTWDSRVLNVGLARLEWGTR
ncbi:hypothetical protein Atai01_06310 [Amycolatopsis taiwanensis]|uniref:Uncharacterized protein n=1 Tax=Amycolatopsis taiwanensis TaxID=342230 RepID=A0A9W6VE11_9PSEU|nr:hypothetical protein Atai01_06310 [Amycolatopsis taiwanensis]